MAHTVFPAKVCDQYAASFCFNIASIWLSLNRDVFIENSPVQDGKNFLLKTSTIYWGDYAIHVEYLERPLYSAQLLIPN